MEKSLTSKIMEHLVECGDLLLQNLFLDYHERSMLPDLWPKKCRHAFSVSQKPSISVLLNRLKKEGLIKRTGTKRNSHWKVTKRGKEKFQNPLPKQISYELPALDGVTRLITFDIPEDHRKKRDWLRTQLVISDFRMLHKSVWIGHRPLSEDLIGELRDRDLLPLVHIISVDKKGTLA